MNPSTFLVPVTIQIEDKKYKYLYAEFKQDGSIHLIFPLSSGYKIIKETNTNGVQSGTTTVKLEAKNDVCGTPYISYHPGKHSAHVNLQPTGNYLDDIPVVELSKDQMASIFPLCTVVLSNPEFLDHYMPKKEHGNELTFREKKSDKHLCLEFWVHSSDKRPRLENLPFADFRIQQGNIVNFVTLTDSRIPKYTVSILATVLDKDMSSSEDFQKGIHLVLWGKGRQSFLLIQPQSSMLKNLK